MTALLAKIKGDYKVLEKQVLKEARSMDKVNAKRKKSKGSRAPSGFVKPTAISKDLAKFLGVAEDTKMARTDVTKMITAYVKDNKLQAPNNGRKIIPDKKLMVSSTARHRMRSLTQPPEVHEAALHQVGVNSKLQTTFTNNNKIN